jgi:hypothetical protein
MTRARHSSLELPTPEPSGEPGGECQRGKPDDLTSSTVGVCGSTPEWEKPASAVPVTLVNGRDPVCAAEEHAEKQATWLTRVGRACSDGGGVLPAPELATRLRPSAPEVLMASHDLPLGVLTQNSRDSLAPNGDIRATLEWGYYPLTDAERVVFERPNAASGWTLQAADAHCLLHNPLVLGLRLQPAGRWAGRRRCASPDKQTASPYHQANARLRRASVKLRCSSLRVFRTSRLPNIW